MEYPRKKINVKFQEIIMKIEKIEYFREQINSTHERKRKAKTDLGGKYIGDSKARGAGNDSLRL